MLCSVSDVSIYKAQNGELSADDWKKLIEAKKKIESSKISISYTKTLSVEEVIDECRKVKNEQGLDLVMIDYVQLMTTTDSNVTNNRSIQCSTISRKLKLLAKELDIGIILVSQLSRDAEERADHRPILADLRECGAIEIDADKILFIYNPDIYESDDSVKQEIRELIVAKNRQGEKGTIKLKFIQECLRFESLYNKK